MPRSEGKFMGSEHHQDPDVSCGHELMLRRSPDSHVRELSGASLRGHGCPRSDGRFMRSSMFLSDLLTGHEPEMLKHLEINKRIFRFMEREHFKNFDVS